MQSYYERYDEAGRLARGDGLLEFARMKELIQCFLRFTPREWYLMSEAGRAGIRVGWLEMAMKSTLLIRWKSM